MVKVKVLKGFIGSISGNHGQELEIEDQAMLRDLVQAGYVLPVEEKHEINAQKKNYKKEKVVKNYENE